MDRGRRGLLAVTVVLALSGCGAPSYEDEVPALAQPQTEQDRLPDGGDGAAFEAVAAGSTRYLGGTQVAEYWVGLDDEDICLVQSLRGTGSMGASCADAGTFGRSGVWLTTSASGVSASGLLVPGGFDLADAAVDEDWVSVNDNLAAPADEGGS